MDLTILEIHLDDVSFSADRPFSNLVGADEDEDEDTETAVDDPADDDPLAADDDTGEGADETQTTDSTGTPTTALAAVGVLVALGAVLALRRLLGGDDPDVDIETPEDDENRPVGVAVDE